MESLSTGELCQALTQKGIRCSAIEDNEIDGEALLELVNDSDEFCRLVTAPLVRLRLKRFVRETQELSEGQRDKDATQIQSGEASGSMYMSGRGLKRPNSNTGSDVESEQESAHDHEPEEPPAAKRMKPAKEEDLHSPCPAPEALAVQFNLEDFELPTHFSRKVEDAIAKGTLTEQKNELAFIREIVSFFEGIVPNPTPKEYEAISRKVVDKYPCLKDSRRSEYWYTVNKKISQRYRNNRKEGRGPRKVPKERGYTIKVSRSTEVDSDADDEKENIAALAKLASGRNASAQLIQELLEATRKARGDWLKDDVSIRNILQKYPIFKQPKWLLYEFKSIVGDDSIDDTMRANWRSVADKLLGEKDVSFVKEKALLDTINKNVYHKKPMSAKLPVVFIEACGDIEKHFKRDVLEPQLIVFYEEDEIVQQFLVAEQEPILELDSSTIVAGLVLLMASYYVFDVDYPPLTKATFYFIQDYVMDRFDDKPRPLRYSTFVKNAKL